MARDLNSYVESAIGSKTLEPVMLLELNFSSGPVYLWTGYGDLVYDGKTYIGGGELLGVGNISETNDTTAQGISVSLSGVPLDMISLVLTESDTFQGREANILLGVMQDGALLGATQIFSGAMDTMTIAENGETSTIAVSIENELLRLLIPPNQQYTDADQKLDYPEDDFFQYVNGIQQADILWGQGSAVKTNIQNKY